MNEYQQLLQLGFTQQSLMLVLPQTWLIILKYSNRLMRELGLNHQEIIQFAQYPHDSLDNFFNCLAGHGSNVKRLWNINNRELLKLLKCPADTIGDLYAWSRLSSETTYQEIIDTERPLLFMSVLSQSQKLSDLGISKNHLLILIKLYQHTATANDFFEDARVVLKQLKFTVVEWGEFSKHNNCLSQIIQCHEKLLQIQLFSREEILQLARTHDKGQLIQRICEKYSELLELGLTSAMLKNIVQENVLSDFILVLLKHKTFVAEYHINPEQICQIWKTSNQPIAFEPIAFEQLVACRQILQKLSLADARHFPDFCRNHQLSLTLQAVSEFQNELTTFGIVQPTELVQIIKQCKNPKAIELLIKHKQAMQACGILTCADVCSLLHQWTACGSIPVFAKVYQQLRALDISPEQLRIALVNNKYHLKSIEAVAAQGPILKEKLHFTSQELMSLINMGHSGQKTIVFVIKNIEILAKIPKNEILLILTMNITSTQREISLQKLIDSQRAHTPQVEHRPEPVAQPSSSEIDQLRAHCQNLESLLATQTLALTELSRSNQRLTDEVAVLRSQGQKRLQSDVDLAAGEVELIEPGKRARTSFFIKK